jgi:hypothetical protein
VKCPHCNKEIKQEQNTYIVEIGSELNRSVSHNCSIKGKDGLRNIRKDIEGTYSRIISVKHCTVNEYNKLQENMFMPDFI